MSDPVILWRESFGYGNSVWNQVYLSLSGSSNNSFGDLGVASPANLAQWGRGSGADQGWSMQGSHMGLRATTLGFSGAIDTNAMTNNKIGVAFAYNQGGHIGDTLLCDFWDDDGLGDGSFSKALLHLSVEVLNDGRLCVRNGSGSGGGNKGTIIGISTFVMPVGANQQNGNYTHIEIVHPVIHATSGSVQVYADSTLVLNLSGVSTRNVIGGSGKIGYVQIRTDSFASCFATDAVFHDCSGTGRIGDQRVSYRRAEVSGSFTTGSGTYTAGVATGAGTLLACVSEQQADGDTTYIQETNAALPKKVSFPTEPMPANTASIAEVTELIIHRKTDASANTARYGMISGATEVDNGVDLSTPTGYALMTQAGPAPGHQVDPHTSAAWSIVNCDAAEIVYQRVA
jgi:hypothetical protein